MIMIMVVVYNISVMNFEFCSSVILIMGFMDMVRLVDNLK